MTSSHNPCMEIHNPPKKRLIKPNNLASSSWLYISDDILTEILCRLPWKSIVRFKCVNKHWLSLINSMLLPKKDLLLGLFYQDYSHRKLKVKFAAVSTRTRLRDNNENFVNMRVNALNCLDFRLRFLPCSSIGILGCNRGMILCANSCESNEYYVCNPITKQYVSLLRPDVSLSMIGLYVEKESGHFQVVLIPLLITDKSDNVQIFSSVTGTWKKSASCRHSKVPSFSVRLRGCQGVQAGRSLYWFIWNEVVHYDIDTENLRVIELPKHWKELGRGRLVEIDGVLLSLFTVNPSKTEIWKLREGWWECVREVDFSAIIRPLCSEINCSNSMNQPLLQPIGFHSSVPDAVFFKLGLKVFWFNFETEEAELLIDYDLHCNDKMFLYFLPKVPFPFQKTKGREEKVTLPNL